MCPFDAHLAFSDQIAALSKSCYYHIHVLCFISPLPIPDFKTATTTATSIVHSKLDYCNSLCHNLPNCQLNWLQQIQNSLARAIVKAPKSTHITPILKSLHWLKVNEHIEYKLLSLTYKVLTTAQPSYLHNLVVIKDKTSDAILFDTFLHLIMSSAIKSSTLDPLPTFLLREFVDVLLPYVGCMVNSSLRQGRLPDSQKHAVVTPLLKRP